MKQKPAFFAEYIVIISKFLFIYFLLQTIYKVYLVCCLMLWLLQTQTKETLDRQISDDGRTMFLKSFQPATLLISRPSNKSPRAEGNRAPSQSWSAACSSWVNETINYVDACVRGLTLSARLTVAAGESRESRQERSCERWFSRVFFLLAELQSIIF